MKIGKIRTVIIIGGERRDESSGEGSVGGITVPSTRTYPGTIHFPTLGKLAHTNLFS